MARTPKVVEDRREQIIDAAVRVFAQKGFIRTTNKEIAQEAGITPGLIYHYFESKEALFHTMLEERTPLSVIKAIPAEMLDLPPETFMRLLLQRVIHVVEGEDFVMLIRAFLPEVILNPSMSTISTDVIAQVITFLKTFLLKKMETGELRRCDPELAAQALIGGLIGFVLRRQILRDAILLQYTQQEVIDAVIDTTLRGLLPRN